MVRLRSALSAAVAAAFRAWPGAGVLAGKAAAYVQSVSGEVRVIEADSASCAASRSLNVYSGETVITGRDARVVLRFSDGGRFSMQPDTRLKIDCYHFAGTLDGSERSYISLLKGGLRAISGVIGHYSKGNFRLITPAATVGVRGTEYAVYYATRLIASVTDGAIDLCNGTGCQRAAEGEAYFVRAADSEAVLVSGPPAESLLP